MRLKKRVLSLLLTACLVVGLMPTAAFAAGTDTGKAIQLGTSGISGYDSTNGYDYIYYGTWNSSAIKWRVLDDQTNTGESGLFLLSDVLLGTGPFGDLYFDKSEPQNYAWQGSGAQAWCKDFAGIEGSSVTDAFTVGELGAVLATTKSDGAFTSSTGSVPFDASDDVLNGDKVFFLSAEEAENSAYGFTDDNARVANYGTSGGTWWLRSPCARGSVLAGAVWETGYVYYYSVGDYAWAARPAFNLDPDFVLFTSAADNSGHNSSFAAPADYSGNEWKLTLKDSNDFSSGASVTGTTALACGYSDTTLTINHAALSTLSADYTNVTAMLTDSNGNILYHGSINETTSATESSVTIPAGLDTGEYTLSVYGEDWNEANYTDYATGTPYTIKITVYEHSWETGWSSDETGHWHECSVCHDKKDSAAHTPGDAATEDTPQTCTECGYAPFKITAQPTSLQLAYGYKNGSLAVTAKTTFGTEKVSYQWYEGGKIITGATASSFAIPKGKPVGSYAYACKLTSGGYSVITKVATVTVKAPSKGSKYKDDKNMATYKVTKARVDGKGTVEYVKPAKKNKSTVTIPATVKIGSVTYKVTSIAKNAFKNNRYIKRLTIEKNVEKIGAKAFYGCKKLKTITIKTPKLTAKKVGANAFKNTHAKATIKVPKKKLKVYKTMFLKKGVSKKAKIRRM